MLPGILGLTRSLETPVFAHWHKLVPDFSTSSQEFYAALEAALAKREIPELKTSRIEYHESGIISALRVYLRIERKKLAFDICAAPFGTAFFFSWWLTEPKKSYQAQGCLFVVLLFVLAYFILKQFDYQGCGIVLVILILAAWIAVLGVREGWFLSEDIILETPYLGALYQYFFDPETYYKEDTRIMYREIVHGAVLEVVDETLTSKGLRALAPEDTKMTTRSLVQR
jgi:hypothetical protein